jgi:hypothetical protein
MERSKTDFSTKNQIDSSGTNTPDQSAILQVGPLNAFTAESVEIIKTATFQIEESKDLRMKATLLMKECFELSKKNTKSVDDLLTKKISETLGLAVCT